MKSYDYAHRKGIEELSWDDIGELSRELAEKLSEWDIDMVIGIARGIIAPGIR